MSDIPEFPPVLERLLPAGHHAQIGAYALESLPPEERIAFEAHLRDCELCQDELPILLDAARTLRQAIAPDTAPRSPAPAAVSTTAEPATWVSARRAQIDEESARAGQTGTVEESGDSTSTTTASPIQDSSTSDAPGDLPLVAATETGEDQAPDQAAADEEPLLDEPSTTLEPLKSSVLLDLPDADTGEIPDADLIAAAAARMPEPAEPQKSRRRRPKGRIAPGAQPTAAQLAVAAPERPSRLPWILGGLGLLFGVGSLIAALVLAETKGNLEEEIAFQNTQIEELNAQRDAYLAQTTAITWELLPTTLGTPGSGGIVFADPAGTSALLSVFGMPGLGADQTYQVWYVLPDGSSVPGPLLTMDANGNAVTALTPDLSPYQLIAVTVEPSIGNELPSTNPVLQGFVSGQ
ncbi:MAG: anti-sigma factor [Thermomicrobiales bacterium]|nr:anti-sigma factor [Thermomicrobiales bacterium]